MKKKYAARENFNRYSDPSVKFTHQDIQHHNILMEEAGQITGLLDWKPAGWYPEFWEYTTALRFVPKDF